MIKVKTTFTQRACLAISVAHRLFVGVAFATQVGQHGSNERMLRSCCTCVLLGSLLSVDINYRGDDPDVVIAPLIDKQSRIT